MRRRRGSDEFAYWAEAVEGDILGVGAFVLVETEEPLCPFVDHAPRPEYIDNGANTRCTVQPHEMAHRRRRVPGEEGLRMVTNAEHGDGAVALVEMAMESTRLPEEPRTGRCAAVRGGHRCVLPDGHERRHVNGWRHWIADTCSLPGCSEEYCAGGYCKLHYDRLRTGVQLDLPGRRRWTPAAVTLAELDALWPAVAPEEIARRMGTSVAAIGRTAYRYGHPAAAEFNRADFRARRARTR